MPRVKKAVIPVAGLGTRFLPVTKAVPKELLPIGTTPALQIVIEEAVASGIEEVFLVSSPNKTQIADYFKCDTRYDKMLKGVSKGDQLDSLRLLTRKIKIGVVVQNEQKGLGHAVLCSRKFVGNEPFVVILPDVLIESKVPCLSQLVEVFERTGLAVNATEHSPREKLHLCGVYDIVSSDGRFHHAKRVIEKPKNEDAPTDLSVVGRYLFTPDIFDVLERTPVGLGGEIQLSDAMDALAKQGRLIAYEYEGFQFDIGEPIGFLKANIFYGLHKHPEELRKFLKTVQI